MKVLLWTLLALLVFNVFDFLINLYHPYIGFFRTSIGINAIIGIIAYISFYRLCFRDRILKE